MNASLRRSVLVTATALLAACGGGGGGGNAPAPTPPPPSGGNPPTNPPDPPTNPPITSDAEQYRSFLEASLRLVLGVDHVAKTIHAVPASIKADVEAHGPFTQCQHSACPDVDTSQWVTFPLAGGGTVRLMNWQETPVDGVLGADEHLYLDLVEIGAHPLITTTAHLYTPGADGALIMNFTADYELSRRGLRLGSNTTTEWTGTLRVKPANGGYELRDHQVSDPDNDRQLIITERNHSGEQVNVWLTNYVSTTNMNDLDAVSFDIDMLNYIGGGRLKLRSDSPINFGVLSGKTIIEAGRYVYEYQGQDKHFALRVSVDPDPAYLAVEIDEAADGTYEKSSRLSQDGFDLAL